MHLLFMTRGVKQQRDIFVKFMETQMFPWERTNLTTGKKETVLVQGALRPVELWEYVFPEEHLNEVLTMLSINPDGSGFSNWQMDAIKRKMFSKLSGQKIDPIPKFTPVPTPRFIETRGVAIYPLGIKRDVKRDYPEWGYNQEML